MRASTCMMSWEPRLLTGLCCTCRNKALAAKLEAERKLKEGISGHRTGLPKKLLELFAPLPLPGVLAELKKRPPKVPYSGIGQYVAGFADKGEPEYEPEPEVPPPAVARPPSPRIFKNPELPTQARLDYETRAEKCVMPLTILEMHVHRISLMRACPVYAEVQTTPHKVHDGCHLHDPCIYSLVEEVWVACSNVLAACCRKIRLAAQKISMVSP